MGRLAKSANTAEEKRIEAETKGYATSSAAGVASTSSPVEGQIPERPRYPAAGELKGTPIAVGSSSITSAESMSQSAIREGSSYYKLPAYLDDLDGHPSALSKWSNIIDQTVEGLILARKTAGKDTHFYNPARVRGFPFETQNVRWRAFPNNFNNRPNKWELADIRENQDEYCEWEVKRDSKGELLSVTFTTELPEYYEFYAATDESGDRLLRVYNDLNPKHDVKREHILDMDGKYMRDNRWNTRTKGSHPETTGCIAHMIRTNNALGDLAELVVDSTVLVKDPKSEGEYITSGRDLLKLMNVSKESLKRYSDPAITARINSIVREGNHVTITNPIGPYIHSFENERIVNSKGRKVENMWSFERGSKDYRVRAKFTIPDKWIGQLVEAGSKRKIKYGSQIAQYVWIGVDIAVANSGNLYSAPQPTQTIMSFIEGRYTKPIPLPLNFVESELQQEPFGKYLSATPNPARTLKDLIGTFRDYTWAAYAADEGIGYKFTTRRKKVRVRLVIICTPDHPAPGTKQKASKMASGESLMEHAFKKPTIAVVVVPPDSDPNNVHSEKSILQVASFNPDAGWFNFYDRERFGKGAGAGQWLYFGNSKDAFAPDTQGLGPFCGHPSGSLTMKESEDPWPHWHTSDNQLDLPPGHLMLSDGLFRNLNNHTWFFDGADLLARMVEFATRAWFNKRRYLDFGSIRDPNREAQRVHQWVAHVCLTTTVTIACAREKEDDFMIPSGFFFNAPALSHLLPGVQELEDQISQCSRKEYEGACKNLGLITLNSMKPSSNDEYDIAAQGEGLAPWKVVVPSKEDLEGMKQILKSSLLPARVLIALLMVDFWNPVFSFRRARLMRYIPSTLIYSATASSDDRYGFGTDLIEAIELGIETLELDPETSPEAEFLGLVRLSNQEEEVKNRISLYVSKVNTQLERSKGVLDYMRLAESKRCLFRPPPSTRRPVHPLAEFDLMLPYATKFHRSETYAMKSDGEVENTKLESKIWHPRNTQSHFLASGCPFSASF